MIVGMLFVGAAKQFERNQQEVFAAMFTYGGTAITAASSLYVGSKVGQRSAVQNKRLETELEFRRQRTRELASFYEQIQEPLNKVDILDDYINKGETRRVRILQNELRELLDQIRMNRPSSMLMPEELDRERIDQTINRIFEYCECPKRDKGMRVQLVHELDQLSADLNQYRTP